MTGARYLVLVTLTLGPGCSPRSAIATSDGAARDNGSDLCAIEIETELQLGKPFVCGERLAVTRDWVLFEDRRTQGSNLATDSELFARRVAGGPVEQLTFDDEATQLLAAEGQLVLYQSTRMESGTFSGSVFLRTADRTQLLSGSPVSWSWVGSGVYTARLPRLVSGGHAAWASAGSTIELFDGSSTRTVVSQAKNASPQSLELRDGLLTWDAWDGQDQEVYLLQVASGELRQLTANEVEDRRPVLIGERVLWQCGEGICLWEAGSTKLLDRGPCSDLDSDGKLAAWICADQVTLFDGISTRMVVGPRGVQARREGVRVASSRIVWLERKPGEDGSPGLGSLFFSDGHSPHRLLAEVHLPCVYCDSYWPPLMVEIAGDTIAWSYDARGQAGPGAEGLSCGSARIVESRRCR